MTKLRSVAATLALACVLVTTQAAEPLRICINENAPPYSVAEGASGKGFDVAVAEAVAGKLGRTLIVQWFESRLDEDASSFLEADALLSDNRCDLLAGYPMLRDALGKPGFATARLPGFRGIKPADRRRRITLGTLAPSLPFHRATFVVVLGPGARGRSIRRLADLDGLKLVVDGGTFADAVLMSFEHGRLIEQITHTRPGRGEALSRVESGEADATMVALQRFDAYRAEHPDTKIGLSDYVYPDGINMGFVALSTETALLAQVNAALGDLAARGELESLARRSGMTYVAPKDPAVSQGLKFTTVEP